MSRKAAFADRPQHDTSEQRNVGNRAVLYVGLAFFALFSGYTVFSSLLPALQPDTGPFVVALNYVAYAAGSLLTPGNTLHQYRRAAFTFAATTYLAWMLTVQTPAEISLWLGGAASVVNGFGAGLLWSTQGDWISQWCGSEQDRAAQLHGIFLFLYGLSGLVGNLGALAALLLNVNERSLQWALCCTSAIGCLLLTCTPARWLHGNAARTQTESSTTSPVVCDILPKDTATIAAQYRSKPIVAIVSAAPAIVMNDGDDAIPGAVSECQKGFETTKAECPAHAIGRWKACRLLLRNRHFLPCLGAIAAVAASAGFLWVAVPVDLSEPAAVTGVFAVYSVSYGITSLCSTVLLRKYSPRTVFVAVAVSLATPTYIYFAAAHDIVRTEHTKIIPFVVGGATFLFGVIMNLYTTTLFTYYTSTLSRCSVKSTDAKTVENCEQIVFFNLSPHAFCVHGALYCLGYALTSVLARFWSLSTMAAAACVVTWLGTGLFLTPLFATACRS